MRNTIATALLALLAIIVTPALTKASFVTLDGGNSWTGWNSVGNSKTNGVWVTGSTGTGANDRTYNIYSTSFVLTAGQTASSPLGNDTSSLFAGSWMAGDRIVGMGLQYTGSARGKTFFFHRDAGAVNIKAASSFGATDGVVSFDVGDSSSYITPGSISDGTTVRQYSVFTGFSPTGGDNFNEVWSSYTDLMPVRSFMVQDNLGKKSVQFLMNMDAILRSPNGEGSFGSTLRLGFMEFGPDGGVSQQIFEVSAVPEPGASALLFLGLASIVSRLRRR